MLFVLLSRIRNVTCYYHMFAQWIRLLKNYNICFCDYVNERNICIPNREKYQTKVTVYLVALNFFPSPWSAPIVFISDCSIYCDCDNPIHLLGLKFYLQMSPPNSNALQQRNRKKLHTEPEPESNLSKWCTHRQFK